MPNHRAANSDLKSGQLVRYLATTARWHFARVRRVRGADVEVAFFGESGPFFVPRAQIESLTDFFERRERVFSVDRARLTSIYYGHALERLHEEKVREMQGALSKAGVAFEPQEWPSPDTRIRLWLDISVVARDPADRALSALLPQWLEPFVLPSGSRDPLGLQGPAERLVNEVLPGLNVFTFRAGYYGFLAWTIRHVNELTRSDMPVRKSRLDVLHALERALVLCEFVFHGHKDDSCTLIGQRSKIRVLGGAQGDRFVVPESILKNQHSAGSFRLFTTSLASLGLVEDAPELSADGLLPHRMTPLGETLARSFQRRLDPTFPRFAAGEGSRSRDTLRAWGDELCFSTIAKQTQFRRPLLEGLLLGNSRDAEKRYATVRHLFAQRLLGGEMPSAAPDSSDAMSEDEGAALEGPGATSPLANLDVALHFYECAPREELKPLQALTVFEFLALGLSAIFRAAVAHVTEAGRVNIVRLVANMAGVPAHAELWSTPMATARPKTVRKLVFGVLDAKSPLEAASAGGLLLLRLIRDPLAKTVWDSLLHFSRQPSELVDRFLRQRMERSLADALPEMLVAMAERHEVVSERKNRQRWLCVENGDLVRDDTQDMGVGLHALRFHQLGSLARDLALTEEDLRHG